jgi:hypothetical protein
MSALPRLLTLSRLRRAEDAVDVVHRWHYPALAYTVATMTLVEPEVMNPDGSFTDPHASNWQVDERSIDLGDGNEVYLDEPEVVCGGCSRPGTPWPCDTVILLTQWGYPPPETEPLTRPPEDDVRNGRWREE